MSLGENIKRLRLEAGLQTQKALADLLGVGVQILQISGTGYPLHDIGGCLPSLVPSQGRGALGDHRNLIRAASLRHAVVIRIRTSEQQINRAAESLRNLDEGQGPQGGIAIPLSHSHTCGCGTYGVQIRSESMLPTHRPTMIAIVSPRCCVQDGDEAYVHLVSGECLVRLVFIVQRVFVLQPYNHACAARFAKPREIRAMHVIVYSRRREF